MELDLAKAGIHMFVEKPVSVQSAEEVGKLAEQLEECYNHKGSIITAGYMLRYSAWVSWPDALSPALSCPAWIKGIAGTPKCNPLALAM